MEQLPTNEAAETAARPAQVEAQANLQIGDTLVLKDGTRIRIVEIDDKGPDLSRTFTVEKRTTMSDRAIFALFRDSLANIEKAN